MANIHVDPLIEGDLIMHEQDYWDTWADALPYPQGVVKDAESYKKAVKEKKEEKK